MKTYLIFLIILAVLVMTGCKNDSTGPQDNANFSVTVAVKNSFGFPVGGLRISCWNKLPQGISASNSSKTSQAGNALSTTTIMFAAPIQARLTFKVYDMNNTLLSDILDHEYKPAGTFSANVSMNITKPTRLLKYTLTAQDSALTTTYYRKTLYALLYQPDPARSILGWTSADGTFSTNDTLAFPNVLSVRSFNYTQTDPSVLATFSLSDTIEFTLTDTLTHKFQQYERVVSKNVANNIDLVWNPTTAYFPLSHEYPRDPILMPLDVGPGGSVPTEWSLMQNYPNPFY